MVNDGVEKLMRERRQRLRKISAVGFTVLEWWLVGVLWVIWGVVDFVPGPSTDFPDIRCQAFVHSAVGTILLIPRENDRIRLYIQQSANHNLIDPQTGRVDKDRTSPEKIIQEAAKILSPYRIDVQGGEVHWWTVYAGGCLLRLSTFCGMRR